MKSAGGLQVSSSRKTKIRSNLSSNKDGFEVLHCFCDVCWKILFNNVFHLTKVINYNLFFSTSINLSNYDNKNHIRTRRINFFFFLVFKANYIIGEC